METKYNIYPNCWNSYCYDCCFFKISDSIKFGIAIEYKTGLSPYVPISLN